jgi:Domain of unknown function (DUF4417)
MTAGLQLHAFPTLPERRLDGTKSSAYWKRLPGNFDKLNLRVIWPRMNTWGIPELEPEHQVPASLAAWHDPRGLDAAGVSGGAVHFFIDDYRFEAAWNQPERGLERVRRTGAALTPDFSLWRDMPLAAQLWQVYRSQWLGAFWQYNDIRVIPTAHWAGPESFAFCFEGLPRGGLVAVSAVGVRDAVGRQLFALGLEELIRRAAPSGLLVYGDLPEDCGDVDLPPVTVYPSFWQQRKPGGK